MGGEPGNKDVANNTGIFYVETKKEQPFYDQLWFNSCKYSAGKYYEEMNAINILQNLQILIIIILLAVVCACFGKRKNSEYVSIDSSG